jgi:hypothetical protein
MIRDPQTEESREATGLKGNSGGTPEADPGTVPVRSHSRPKASPDGVIGIGAGDLGQVTWAGLPRRGLPR